MEQKKNWHVVDSQHVILKIQAHANHLDNTPPTFP